MSEWKDECASTGGFYRPKDLAIGASEEIVVVGAQKWEDTKYPIKGKTYTYRFTLADGRHWDVSNVNRVKLLQGLHPNGGDAITAGRFQVTNHGMVKDKQPATSVVYLGVFKDPTRIDL